MDTKALGIITETLTGVRSVRGVGFLEIDGNNYAICGSRPFDFGRGQSVSYLACQLKILSFVEPEMKATRRVTLHPTAINDQPAVKDEITGEGLLYLGYVPGSRLLAGADTNGAEIVSVHPPFKVWFVGASTYAANYSYDEGSPYYDNRFAGSRAGYYFLTIP